jgi:molecular chaperone GrpE
MSDASERARQQTPAQTSDDQPVAGVGAGGADGDPTAAADTAAPGTAAAGATRANGEQPASPGGEAAQVEGDLDELVEVAAQRDEYLALAQRTQADFENYRKRLAREVSGAQQRGVAALAKELLPALDNLDRALAAADEDDPLLQGVDLVRSELRAALARMGIESFSPEGEQFDPAVHEAVATAPQSADGPASGTVVEVLQPGYRAGENVIRPARVVVAA